MFSQSIWDDFSNLRRSFDQMFSSIDNNRRNQSEWSFIPAVETAWTEDYVNLRVVVPGVKESDLKVSQQGNELVIQGERKAPEDLGKDGAFYNQLAYGKFERTIALPNGLDMDKLQARLHEGLLDIRIPVAAAVKPKQIPINSESSQSNTRSIAA
jgi:HSP20 family protein